MGSIILTGIRYGKHEFSLEYPIVDDQIICRAHCECGYQKEIINFRTYAGGQYLEMIWRKHIGSKGMV